ncbi:MAG TPA: dihydroorotase family protein [Candidatus Nitrosotalea sp.]|nr:dihydroorotase family protein [Candidatus Nitrosotalea sp.]
MTVDAVITGSHVILQNEMVEKNIIIDEGKIVGLTRDTPSCDLKIKGDGLVSLAGVIDPHIHYGVYSPIDEAAITESKVAAIGGVTTMMRMLRLHGSYKKNLDSQLAASSKSHYVDYSIHASILQKDQINEMEFCKNRGITSFKIYMNLGEDVGHVYMDMQPGDRSLREERIEMTTDMIEQIIAKSASLNCPVLVHAEDYQMCSCGIQTAKEKKMDGLAAWSQSRPVESEVKSIKTVSQIARKYGCTIYFVHIGSNAAIHAISEEKRNGTKIHVETCPHYLTLSYESQKGYLAKVMPPIRSLKDVESVWHEIQNGMMDTIGTDHVANRLNLKLGGETVWNALAGFPGMGTMLPILLSEGVNKGRINLQQLSHMTSLNTARIFGMYPKKGIIQKGSDADIVLVDLKKEGKVSSETIDGFSDYNVYEGWSLKGWPVKTIVRGNVIAEDFKVIAKSGYGKFVARP